MAKYRKKPVVIDAVEWKGNNFDEVKEFCPEIIDGGATWFPDAPKETIVKTNSWPLFIETLEGRMCANISDFILKGVAGEFYPCKPDIFAETYELVE